MNINAILEEKFKNFEFEGIKIPIAPNFYEGDATTYLVYYTYATTHDDFANDVPQVEVASGTLDIYSNTNYKKLKNEVKRKLVQECDFTLTGDGYEDYEKETGLWHIPINFVAGDEITYLN